MTTTASEKAEGRPYAYNSSYRFPNLYTHPREPLKYHSQSVIAVVMSFLHRMRRMKGEKVKPLYIQPSSCSLEPVDST